MSIKRLLKLAVVSAIYVVLTTLTAPISFGAIQFRISEVLVLLCFFKKDYSISLILGCFIANLFSVELGYYDLIFGTVHTALSVLFISHSKHLFVSSLWPSLFIGIIALEMWLFLGYEFWITLLTLTISEMVVVSGIGFALFKILSKNKEFMNLITE